MRFSLLKLLTALTTVLILTGLARTGRAADKTPPAELDPDHAEKMERGLAIFEQHVRPILVEQCFRCHGGEFLESEFSIATREALLKGGAGGKVVVPGDADASRLIKLIRHEEEPYMPMDAPRLTDEQIARIADWINHLAPYDRPLGEGETGGDWTERTVPESARDFWSLRPLAETDPPAVPDDNWSRTPVDRFILARLREQGLNPSEPASRRILIRRAYLDLLGLPPTWDEVAAFVNDPSPDAWEQLIDRLLANPHYGERWARHWLDLARFAESHGFEHDTDRPSAYHYRDFVIEAFNAGMPYDQFMTYQLAGDEVAPHDRLALMATGFLAAGVHSTQITISEAERHRYDEMDDMLNTTCTTFLGLTVGCARCHDHKFDPIPSADYYRMLSTFTTTIRSEVEINFDPEGYARDKAVYDAAHAPLVAALRQYEEGPLREAFEQWLASGAADRELPAWIILDEATVKANGGAEFARQADGSFLASGANPLHDAFTFQAVVDLPEITGLRLEALSDPSLPQSGPGRAGNGNFALTDIRVSYRPAGSDESYRPLKLTSPAATFEQTSPPLPVSAAIDVDPLSAWAVDPAIGRDHAATFRLEEPLQADTPVELSITLNFSLNVHHGIGRPRLSVTSRPDAPALDAPSIRQSTAAVLKGIEGQPTSEHTAALRELFQARDPEWNRLHAAVRAHEVQMPRPAVVTVLIASEGLPPLKLHTQSPREFFDETFFLKRGDVNQKVKVAQPGFLQAVSAQPDAPPEDPGFTSAPLAAGDAAGRSLPWNPPEGWQTSGRRARLAQWMADVDRGAGRLLARVIVNRLWQHHFGEGIVRTPSDFGQQGEPPTHPELLDWLAGRLIDYQWDLKPIHRLLMTSAAYCQSSSASAEQLQADPDNRLFARFEPWRLEAEIVRDVLLAFSGRLNDTMYGPGTLDPSMTRRSIYFTIKRSELVPAMLVFDAPDALGSIGKRPTTTVAPQALYLMNNAQVRACAAAAASRFDTAENPAETAFREIVGREPDEHERARTSEFLRRQSQMHAAEFPDDASIRALTDLCQVLLSLNETIYVQ